MGVLASKTQNVEPKNLFYCIHPRFDLRATMELYPLTRNYVNCRYLNIDPATRHGNHLLGPPKNNGISKLQYTANSHSIPIYPLQSIIIYDFSADNLVADNSGSDGFILLATIHACNNKLLNNIDTISCDLTRYVHCRYTDPDNGLRCHNFTTLIQMKMIAYKSETGHLSKYTV